MYSFSSGDDIWIFFSFSYFIFKCENPNFIIELNYFSHIHTDLSNYRQVYLHHVKSGLHTKNIRANKNTSYLFASQKRNDLQLELRPPLGGPTSTWRSHLKMEVHLQMGWDLWSEISPPIGSPTSDWRSHLLEVFFIPSGVIIILDYITNY